MTGRTVPEWIGKTADTKIPDAVRLRVFERYGGRCYLSGRKITVSDVWDVDHVVALINGGENRESNLAPALRDKHKAKTAQDVAQKAKSARIRKRQAGIKGKSRLQSRGFDKSPPQRTATRPVIRKTEIQGEVN